MFFQELPEPHREIFSLVGRVADELGMDAYVVGGYVRDFYLGRLRGGAQSETCNVAQGRTQDGAPIMDIDFVTVGSGIRLATGVAEALEKQHGKEIHLSVFKSFGTAQVRVGAHEVEGALDLEFVGARKESYRRDSRKPIVEDGTLQDDQERRDLTINAMSWCLNKDRYGMLMDPFGGVQDLRHRLIRTPVDPHKTFDDDPLRMMRAIRFASQLEFIIEEETLAAIREMAHRIEIISMERIVSELNKILLSPRPSFGLEKLSETGLLNHFLPEMEALHGVEERNGQRHKDNFYHTLEVLDNAAKMSPDLWLRWAALLHDIAKPPTKRFYPGQGWTFHGHEVLGAKWVPKIFRRLSLPLDDRMRYVKKLVRLHLRPIALVSDDVSDSAIRRLLFDAGDDLEDLMTLCRADITSKNEWRVKRYRDNFDRLEQKIAAVEEKDRIRNWTNPIDGEEIMRTFGIGPGREVGRIKNAIKQAIFDGTIPNDEEAARALLMRIKENPELLDPEQLDSEQLDLEQPEPRTP